MKFQYDLPIITVSHQRNLSIDLFRVLAALAVVWIHTPESEFGQTSTVLCRFAVPFFSSCLAALAIQSAIYKKKEGAYSGFIRSRFLRIYFPFVVWSVVYLIARIVKHDSAPGGSPIILGASTLLNGTAHHLWFLPYAFLISGFAHGLGRILRSSSRQLRVAMGLTLFVSGIVVAIAAPFVPIDPIERPVSYFTFYAMDALPSALFGCAIPLFGRIEKHQLISGLCIPAAIGLLLLMIPSGYHPLPANLSGAAFLLFAFSSPLPTLPRWVSILAPISFGLYGIHVLFIEGVQFLLSKIGAETSFMIDLAVFAVSSVLSVVFCLTLARMQPARRFIT